MTVSHLFKTAGKIVLDLSFSRLWRLSMWSSWGSKFFWNVGILWHSYTASQPRKLQFEAEL